MAQLVYMFDVEFVGSFNVFFSVKKLKIVFTATNNIITPPKQKKKKIWI